MYALYKFNKPLNTQGPFDTSELDSDMVGMFESIIDISKNYPRYYIGKYFLLTEGFCFLSKKQVGQHSYTEISDVYEMLIIDTDSVKSNSNSVLKSLIRDAKLSDIIN